MKFFEFKSSQYLLLLFFISSSIWALLSPLGTSPDEYVHVQYSWVVKHTPIKDALVQDVYQIPKSVESASNKRCMVMAAALTAECQKPISQSQELIEAPNFTPGYPPFYYLVVGIPMSLSFSENIWYAMRFVNIFFCSAILAVALLHLKTRWQSGLYFSVLLCLTPMVSFITGAINPSSLEIISGISLSILIAIVEIEKVNKISKSLFISIFFVSTMLSISRPFSWVFAVSLGVIYLLVTSGYRSLTGVNKLKINLAIFLPVLIGFAQSRTINKLRGGQSEIGISIIDIRPDSFLQVIQNNFVGFDNHIYRAIGEFGYIDHRGLELVNQFWSGFFYLAIFFGLRKSSWNFKIGLSLLTFTAIAVVPIAALRTILNGGYGYQSRYAMALICSIPIVAAINKKSNIFNIPEFRAFLIWLVPFGLITDWIISGYRYSHGLPFEILVRDNETYYWWLGQKASALLFTLVLIYFVVTYFHIKYQNSNQKNFLNIADRG